MKKALNFIIMIVSIVIAVYAVHTFTGKIDMLIIYLCGMVLGVTISNIKLMSKKDELNSYKREFEKKSISETETSSKVKVLEAKIESLEKALEKALEK